MKTQTPSLMLFFFLFIIITITSVSCQCLNSQKTLLLKLKTTLKFNPSLSTKLVQWNQTTDCCHWRGVNCDNSNGNIIGVDLTSESITGGLDDSSSLFNLQSLQILNLSNNYFNSAQLPSRFENLTHLRYLNLSDARFGGQIPIGFSRLTKLISLDFSSTDWVHFLKIENPDLKLLFGNLSGLKELYLDGVDISSNRYDWSQVISSLLPNLRVLSLINCLILAPLDDSLTKLKYLSVIRLDQNTFSCPFPVFFANFSHLSVLSLSSCDLYGVFPQMILQVPSLQTIDVSFNRLLEGSLPEFPHNGSLENLVLRSTKFSGEIPNSIGDLRMLSRIELGGCNFSGPIPNSIAKLTQLVRLGFYNNGFTGSIPSSYWEGLNYLESLSLGNNMLSGEVPVSLFTLPSLREIDLSNNRLSGQITEISYVSSWLLDTLDLKGNKLEGPIPKFFFELHGLVWLSLSSNNFNGTVELSLFEKLARLQVLDLSHNRLSVNANASSSTFYSLPELGELRMASCKLQELPDLKNQSKLTILDLSNNEMSGEIPNWIWEVSDGRLRVMNLSHNLFTRIQEPYKFHPLDVLDLHSNLIHGQIPKPPRSAAIVDYSNNNFATSLPADIGYYLASAFFFSVSNNNLVGTIPQSLCNKSRLQILDLSNNSFHSSIPSCLTETIDTLAVLNLRRNNLTGTIPGTFPHTCGLETLDVNGNLLSGQLPKSLSNCTKLEVLNLGSNTINDSFPCWIQNLSNLRVLVLRSNSFHGLISCLGGSYVWPKLQIIDLASNNFSGILPPKSFSNLKAITADNSETQPKYDLLYFKSGWIPEVYYQDSVTVVSKGSAVEWVKIITIFNSIDFSCNSFQGSLPETIGDLKWLVVLNISHNALTGPITKTFGNLKQLESLDLSFNELRGGIPTQLASLTFLSYLNLSYNQLAGRIPGGSQFNTLTESSFEGNSGLCGYPLITSCNDVRIEDPLNTSYSGTGTDILISSALGFVVGLGVIVGPLVFCRKWRELYNKHVDRVISSLLPRLQRGRRRHGASAPAKQRKK